MKKCKVCRVNFIPKRSSLEPTCDNYDCKEDFKRLYYARLNSKPKKYSVIAKVSNSRKIEEMIYKSERIKFLMLPENKVCPITKKPTTDVHHKKGRTGSLYLDKRYWIALSREGHIYVEENPEWAKENGYSLKRLSNELD
jgi:hypothetical protein